MRFLRSTEAELNGFGCESFIGNKYYLYYVVPVKAFLLLWAHKSCPLPILFSSGNGKGLFKMGDGII